jgi:hypothetical protein
VNEGCFERWIEDECAKPYPKNHRRPREAEDTLSGNLETVMRLLKEKEVREEETAVWFLDETSPQLIVNVVRVWSFGNLVYRRTQRRMKSNTIVFMQ